MGSEMCIRDRLRSELAEAQRAAAEAEYRARTREELSEVAPARAGELGARAEGSERLRSELVTSRQAETEGEKRARAAEETASRSSVKPSAAQPSAWHILPQVDDPSNLKGTVGGVLRQSSCSQQASSAMASNSGVISRSGTSDGAEFSSGEASATRWRGAHRGSQGEGARVAAEKSSIFSRLMGWSSRKP